MRHLTIEDMIARGVVTARWAERNGYRWDCRVIADVGDAGKILTGWIEREAATAAGGEK